MSDKFSNAGFAPRLKRMNHIIVDCACDEAKLCSRAHSMYILGRSSVAPQGGLRPESLKGREGCEVAIRAEVLAQMPTSEAL